MFVDTCIIVRFIKEKSNKKQQSVDFFFIYLYESEGIVHQLHFQQPSTYEKPEAASAVLGS
jgi:hypothetical protein